MTEAESTLLAGCVSGDKAAWDDFVQQYSKLVYHTIYRTLARHQTSDAQNVAEDLFQEFFVSCLLDDCKKLRQFRGDRGCSMASWLRVIASRLTVDHLRQRRPREAEVTDAIPSGQADAAEALIAREQDESLAKAIEALPSRDRLFIDLAFRQALGAEEIAAFMQISLGAVYTQKSRLLDKLRESLAKDAASKN